MAPPALATARRVWMRYVGTEHLTVRGCESQVVYKLTERNPRFQAYAADAEALLRRGAVGLDLPAGNQPPVARAGDDRSIVSPTKKTKVQLDGTASTDPEGTKLKFKWLLAGKTLSTSSRPKLSLVAGVHTLTLVATDKKGLLGIDDVVITILAE